MATQVTAYRLEIHESGLQADTFFPGITYDDYDREGGIAPWKVMRMFEAGRTVPFYQGNFLGFHDLRSTHFGFFVLGGEYYFDHCMWEVARKYDYFPYKITITMTHLGETSVSIRQTMTNTLDGREVASFYGKLVYVDKLAKRSQVLPYWHRSKFNQTQSSQPVKVDSTLLVPPNDAYKFPITVGASDVDHNSHTNQSCYVRYCMDAAEAANRSGNLQGFPGDTCLHPITRLTVAYRRETFLGDKLSCRLWQDQEDPFKLQCLIIRGCSDMRESSEKDYRDKDVAFTATLIFKGTPCSRL